MYIIQLLEGEGRFKFRVNLDFCKYGNCFDLHTAMNSLTITMHCDTFAFASHHVTVHHY